MPLTQGRRPAMGPGEKHRTYGPMTPQSLPLKWDHLNNPRASMPAPVEAIVLNAALEYNPPQPNNDSIF